MNKMNEKIFKDPKYLSIIRIIYKNKRIHPLQLAEIFSVSRQAMDYRLNILLKAGYLEKEYIDNKVYYKLSSLGKKLMEEHSKVSQIFRPIITKERSPMYINILLKIHLLIPILTTIIGIIGFIYFYIFIGDLTRAGVAFIIWILFGLFLYYIVRKKIIS